MSPEPASPSSSTQLTSEELRDAWAALSPAERSEGLQLLPMSEAQQLFLRLGSRDQAEMIQRLDEKNRQLWARLLAPDDAADVVQKLPSEQHEAFLLLLEPTARHEVIALLAYAEDAAGGLMNPRFARVRPEMTVDEAIRYVREQARDRITAVYYVYVLDQQQHLLGELSLRELFAAPSQKTVNEIMRTELIKVLAYTDQEEVSRLLARFDLLAIPVVDDDGRMKGVVTIDDAVDVVTEEATEDIQKYGGVEALDAPYLGVQFLAMVKKRAGWLAALFLGEMLTATAMGYFESEIERAVVLALFVPLIISSGGNSGSQASSLIIRAMALEEVRIRDWWRVCRRELASGVALGAILGSIGVVRIAAWQALFHTYGEHWQVIAATVGASLLGVVTFGTLAGSMLPFLLRKAGFDPATASAPFVATLVDVTGLIIYFSVASVILGGTLL